MTNLFNWVASLDSEQMASHILDIILTIYASDAPKSAKDKFFIVQEVNRSGKLSESQMKNWKKLWDPWCKKWGVKWDKFPDYSQAIEILVNKYGDAFSNITIDGHVSVLG